MKGILFFGLNDYGIRKNVVDGCLFKSVVFIWVVLVFGEVRWEREKEFCVV